MSAQKILIVPGWQNSGPEHWQSKWENQIADAERVVQQDWNFPILADWVETLSEAILKQNSKVILVAHSLGCVTVAHLPPSTQQQVSFALLVAPANPANRPHISNFYPVPLKPFLFPSIIVASDDDPYCDLSVAQNYASSWGSELKVVSSAGHINAESGLGDWSQGRQWLNEGIKQLVF